VSTSIIGQAVPRIDGPLKVSGAAKYTSDHHLEQMVYAAPVGATIANGRIAALETSTARNMPGVIEIFHRGNVGALHKPSPEAGMIDEARPPFADDVIRYYGQYVALVVAETFEQATESAKRVKVTYDGVTAPNVDLDLTAFHRVTLSAASAGIVTLSAASADIVTLSAASAASEVEAPSGATPNEVSKRGDPEKAFEASPVKVDQTYVTPAETHNPIELHASVAQYDEDAELFTLYETTQAVVNHRNVMSSILGVPRENVRIIMKYLGSGFGGKLWPWTHGTLAAAAAKQLKRPVKLVVTRKQMFETVGHRCRTQQRVRMSAERDGALTALIHEAVNDAGMLDEYDENCGEATPFFYGTPNLLVTAAQTKRNIGSPTAMRGPGAVPGLFATESAYDELALALDIDPVQLRLRNEPEKDQALNIPFSSRHYNECLTLGAEKFGWSNRTPAIGSMRKDGIVLGWGMAGCSWFAARFDAEARVELHEDGSARVAIGTQDIGTGTYTVIAQLVAAETGIPLDKIVVELGDTLLPPGPISGGSMVTASVIPAVLQAVREAKKARKGSAFASGSGKGKRTFGEEHPKFSVHSYGAQFVEVGWQPEIARLRVNRIVTVVDAGRIINPRMARNQIEGALVMGVGMALFEETHYDPRSGAPINSNLADYVMTTHADAPQMDVTFLDYPDTELNELGARGVGEIGLAGVAPAIASAVYHASGVRVRELPIEIEKLLSR